MKKYMILSLLGKDRPGIVDEVSGLLVKHGANLEDSRMAAMGGCFSIMALFSCEEAEIDAVKDGLHAFEKTGFQTLLYDAGDPAEVSKPKSELMAFEVEAMDHPGIVSELVQVLHGFEADILSVDTRVTNAPLSGEPLFHLSLEAEIPHNKSLNVARDAIVEVAGELQLDIRFVDASKELAS